MFGLIKKIFIGLFTGLVTGSNHTRCISLRNQKCEIQPTLINLHPNKYIQELHYYLFTVKLDRCVGSCNTPNDLSNKVCLPNKVSNKVCFVKYVRFKSKRIQHDYRNKWIENINGTCIMQM